MDIGSAFADVRDLDDRLNVLKATSGGLPANVLICGHAHAPEEPFTEQIAVF